MKPIPITAANRDKIPFPCWLLTVPQGKVAFWRKEYEKGVASFDRFGSRPCVSTHWLSGNTNESDLPPPDQPDRPTCVPEGAATSAAFDRAVEKLNNDPAIAKLAAGWPNEQGRVVDAAGNAIEPVSVPASATPAPSAAIIRNTAASHFAGWVGPEQAKQHAEELQQVRQELDAARNGTTAWIGDIQRFNVALGLIPAAHRTETLDAIEALRAERDDLKRQVEAEIRMRRTMESAHGTVLSECVKLRAELTAARKELDDTSVSLTEWMQCAQRRADKLTAADEQVRVLRHALTEIDLSCDGSMSDLQVRNGAKRIASAALATQPKEDRK